MIDRFLDWLLDDGARFCVVIFAILLLIASTAITLGLIHDVLLDYGLVGGR